MFCGFSATGQVKTFVASPLAEQRIEGLNEEISSYSLFELDLIGLDEYVQNDGYSNQVNLDITGYGIFNIDLIHNRVTSSDYALRAATPEGIVTIETGDKIKTFKGYVDGRFHVRLTIDEDFISGFIETRKGTLILESAYLRDRGLSRNQLLVYYNKDDIAEYPNHCEPRLAPGHFTNEPEPKIETRAVGECYDVEIALANDWLMYEERDEDLQEVENHNLAVINNVQSNYDDEFLDEVNFVVTEIFVSTCSSCDPWTSSTDAGDLLDAFGA